MSTSFIIIILFSYFINSFISNHLIKPVNLTSVGFAHLKN